MSYPSNVTLKIAPKNISKNTTHFHWLTSTDITCGDHIHSVLYLNLVIHVECKLCKKQISISQYMYYGIQLQ